LNPSYIFLDGYKKVLAAKNEGRLQNIDLLLPVIELRLDMFGGSRSNLSRANFHIIFSDKLSIETIESQFLNALQQDYNVSPHKSELTEEGKWSGIPTIESLTDLGQKIIDSVPETERNHYGSPIEEGFNNHCVSLKKVQQLLSSPYFTGKFLTALGKTEWADIKWNDQSIATKKTLINNVDLVFISSANCESLIKARKSLVDSDVNSRLLDCSDAHRLSSSTDKDKIGKCYTWIKSDTSFEGLRQAVHLYDDRVYLAEESPISPLRKITKVKLEFPIDSQITTGSTTSSFCFSGTEHTIHFSPNLTCIIGGRGTGKSTLLNLLHEKVYPNQNTFFNENKLSASSGAISIDDFVNIDDGEENLQIEFIEQNQIEQFAADPEKLTEATFARLLKIDTSRSILDAEGKASYYLTALDSHIELHKEKTKTAERIQDFTKSLKTNERIIASLENDDYSSLTKDLKILSAENEAINRSQTRFVEYTKELSLLSSSKVETESPLVFDILSKELAVEVFSSIKKYENNTRLKTEVSKFNCNKPEIESKKQAIEDYLKGKGLTKENLNDATNATERVEHLSVNIEIETQKLAEIDAKIRGFTEINNIADHYRATITRILGPINSFLSELGTHVKPIRLEYAFNYKTLLYDIHNDLLEIYATVYNGKRRMDSIVKAFENIDFKNLPSQKKFVAAIDPRNKIGSSLITFFSNKDNYDIFVLEVKRKLSDILKYKTINVFYDDKPITATSFGQRCTTAIVILILLGNTPIIIDEPEAHLDSSLIAQYLVNILKSKKLERQIIFASHNANFVINGDAELIHILDMGDDGKTQITSSTIENLENRERLLALEGGKEAFKLRETRYGI